MKIINLIKAETVMLIGELKQYKLNTIFYNISLLVMFLGLFYTYGREVNKESLILLYGLITWQLSSGSISYMSYVIQDESLLGTLEQIFMTRTNIFSVFTSKIVVNFTFDVIKSIVLFILCLFLFNAQYEFFSVGFNNFYVLLIILFTVISFYMLGLVFGGLALFFKRIGSFVQIITYILLFFTNITVPVESLPSFIQPISYMIPISWAMNCINLIVNGSISSSEFIMNLLGLLTTSTIFIIAGYIAFIKSIKRAKKLGKLGQY